MTAYAKIRAALDAARGVHGDIMSAALAALAELEREKGRADARIAELEAKLSAACDIICDLGGEFREPDMDDARRRAKDAARWRYCNAHAEWFRNEERTHIAIAVKHGADLSCKAFREMAIDAARAGNGGEG